jgi:hypothetical protein
LKAEFKALRQSVDVFTKATVENVIIKIMTYASRPLSEFNKFEALDMVENLNNVSQEQKHAKHAYHRMVYQTLRGKMSVSTEQFRSLLLRLLGDKHHERIFDIVAKVEKRFQSRPRDSPQGSNVNTPNRVFPYRRNVGRCFYCQRFGHFQAQCILKKLDEETRRRTPQVSDASSSQAK